MIMHRFLGSITAIGLAAGLAGGASAQTVVDPNNVTARDVVLTPFSTLNLDKDPVPELLIKAIQKPYDLTGLRQCSALQNAVRDLDTVLGDDIDTAEDKTKGEKRGNAVGGVAKSLIGSLIPFGGVIRELSGANENQRRWQMALYAGSTRRSFLKGVGQQRGCAYPARSAEFASINQIDKERARIDAARKNRR